MRDFIRWCIAMMLVAGYGWGAVLVGLTLEACRPEQFVVERIVQAAIWPAQAMVQIALGTVAGQDAVSKATFATCIEP